MITDGNLLKKAHDAGAQFVEAERQVLLARAEYHIAVRRLHLGGASLRETALTRPLPEDPRALPAIRFEFTIAVFKALKIA